MGASKVIVPSLTFIFGAGAGFAVGAVITRKKWQKKSDEEIKAIKELFYSQQTNVKETDTNKDTPAPKKKGGRPPKKKSEEFTEDVVKEYKDYSKMYDSDKAASVPLSPELSRSPEVNVDDVIYYISDIDYAAGTNNVEDLTFYSDGVLVDSDNNPLYPDDERDMVAGLVNNAAFSERDVVYIRNDLKELDYEVTYDNRKWSDIQKNRNNSHPTED